MEIFNRPPTVAEDTLQYTLHLPKDLSDKASATTFAACIRTYVEDLLPGFIWHRDAFELKVVLDNDPDNPNAYILEGRMRVGDCVDDEWCTVWLLKEISAKWDIVISVFDSDGEFLLIEAAETLPSWVKPTNSDNRVWIYSSRLHLIPISHISPPSRKRHRRQLPGANEDEDRDNDGIDDDDEYISTQDAIKLVRDPSVPTFAANAIENTVWSRISSYPNATRSHVHNTKAYIPSDIALSLLDNPSLIQKAVEAFYTRDAIQLRAAHRMNRFPPDEGVLSMVKMTRTAYAQLLGQKFFPPKIFGHWSEPEGSKEWRWRDVGMKIAVGFEMLYQESKGRTDTSAGTTDSAMTSSVEAKKDALRRNAEYNKYIQNLRSVNYFKGEIEGSELWRALENKAADMFVDIRKEDDASRPSFASQVNIALSHSSRTTPILQGEEDSDDWLNINSRDFETMLEQSMGNSNVDNSAKPDGMYVDTPEDVAQDRLASEQAAKLKELASKVEDFIEGEGDLEGAMFEDDVFSDEEFSDEESETDNGDEENEPFDTTARQAAMETLVAGIDPSDYGKMPASFHSNSQRTAPMDANEMETVDNEPQPSPTKEPRAKPIRQPIIPRDKYDGVDSDDETDEDEVEDEESEEDRPQVVGEIEIDMEEEEEEFLEFSRQALGISDDQWNDIIQDRKERGAFLPASAKKNIPPKKTTTNTTAMSSEKEAFGRPPAPGPRPNVNPNLDSFEAVMQAMDVELSRLRSSSKKAAKGADPLEDKGKGKGKATVEDDDEDIETAMEAELRATLDREDENEDANEEPPDYNLIKNFLESFKSQAGLSGPVSNLAGILQPQWRLPRDSS